MLVWRGVSVLVLMLALRTLVFRVAVAIFPVLSCSVIVLIITMPFGVMALTQLAVLAHGGLLLLALVSPVSLDRTDLFWRALVEFFGLFCSVFLVLSSPIPLLARAFARGSRSLVAVARSLVLHAGSFPWLSFVLSFVLSLVLSGGYRCSPPVAFAL